MDNQKEPDKIGLAGFRTRISAMVGDVLFGGFPVAVIMTVLFIIFVIPLAKNGEWTAARDQLDQITQKTRYVNSVIIFIYFWLLTGSYGWTLGKRYADIKVVEAGTFNKIGFKRAFLREGLKIFLNSIPFVGYAAIFLNIYLISHTPGKQAIYDKIARTQVIIIPRDEKKRKKLGLAASIFTVVLFASWGILAYQYWPLLSQSSPAVQKSVISETADWQTYKNEVYGFEVKYPPDAEVVRSQFNDTDRINLPFTQRTLLVEKYLILGVKEITSTEACSNPMGTTIRETKSIRINNVGFKKEIGGDAGAGNLYESESYSTTRDSKCFSLSFILRSVNPGVFTVPPQDFDREKESKIFNQMLSTFKFLESPIELNEIKFMEDFKDVYSFGYGVEWVNELKQIDDIDKDSYREFLVRAAGAGGTCVGGTSYAVLFSPQKQEYFIATESILGSLPIEYEKTAFCPIINPYFWKACEREEYLEFTCFSNNLKEEKNKTFKTYLESILAR